MKSSPSLNQLAVATMSFPNALKEVLTGGRITRLAWNDPQTYGLIYGGFLMIHKSDDSLPHQWLVSEGDLFAADWVTV